MNSTQPTIIPKLRVEKSGSKNKDDLRVMLAGVFFCILFLFGQSAYQKLHDEFFATRPFIMATVEIIHVEDGLPPLIKYDADPNQNVSGTWIASIYAANKTRITSRRGQGNYFVSEDEPRLWYWDAFFNNEESDPPAVPDEPFYVCVRYQVEATDSGVDDSTDGFCSSVYDPNAPHKELTEIIEEIIK